MDLAILFALVGALVVVSGRWGFDSRESIRSKEEELATRGYQWDDALADQSRGGPGQARASRLA